MFISWPQLLFNEIQNILQAWLTEAVAKEGYSSVEEVLILFLTSIFINHKNNAFSPCDNS